MSFPGVGVGFFILIFFWTSVSSKKLSFGCDVGASAYYRVPNPLKGAFGDLDSSQILAFENETAFKEFHDKISSIFSKFKKNLEYSSLSTYYKFYQTYTAMKQCTGYPGFLEFYNEYLLENFPYDEAGGKAIQLMETLTKNFPKLARSAYFVTRSEISPDNLGLLKKHILTSESYVELPDYFHEEQMAVVIKFRYEGLSGYGGYIMLDPEMPMQNPAVFRLDSGDMGQVKSDKVSFEIIRTLNKHLAESQFMTAAVKHGSSDEPTMYVYDFKRPYCTFVETMMRPSLLAFTHSKELHDSAGVSRAKLTAHIGVRPGQNMDQYFYHVQFLLYDQTRTKTVGMHYMKDVLFDMKYHYQSDLQRFCERMGIKKKKCLDSMAQEFQLLQTIFKDKDFLEQCRKALTTPVTNEYEENSSGAVLRTLDPEAMKIGSFKRPKRTMVWEYLEKKSPTERCESYGYGSRAR